MPGPLPILDAVSLYGILYRALLNRDLTSTEIEGIEARYGNSPVDPRDVGYEIENSLEFHMLHRETAAQKLFPTSSVVIGRGPMGHELFVDLRQFHLGFAIALGHFEPDETAFVRSFIKPGMNVVDVGGNIGYFTTMFAAMVGNSGSVTAFEPVTETWRRLTAAVRRNNLDHIVQVHKAAASSESGTCDVSYELHSLNMGGVHLNIHGDAPHAVVETVETVRLDDILVGKPIDFIKMDVEGAEGLALAGAGNLIARNRPTMMVEFNREQLARVSQTTPEALFNMLVGFGYTAHFIGEGGSLTSATQIDDRQVANLAFFPV